MRFIQGLISISLFMLIDCAIAANTINGPRKALVIGNNDYQYVSKLNNPIRDAQTLNAELTKRGFEVIFLTNTSRTEMNDAIDDFIARLSSDAVGIVYYSGHGVQINGANYLLPIDINAKKESNVVNDAIALENLLSRMTSQGTKFSLAIIDACRDNPFQQAGKSIGSGKGLSVPIVNAEGIMVVYAAGANQIALDRLSITDRNPNSLFTREFVKAMRVQGLTVHDVVKSAKTAVINQARAVGHKQTPAIYDQSTGEFVFSYAKLEPIVAIPSVSPPLVVPTVPVPRLVQSTVKPNKIDSFQYSQFHKFKKLSSRINLVYDMISQASNNDFIAADRSLDQINNLPSLNHSNSKKARKINNQGRILIQSGDSLGAAKLFLDAFNLNYADSEIAGNLGYATMRYGKMAEAKQPLIHSLALNPKRSISWIMLGQVLTSISNINEGIGCFRLALRYAKNIERTKLTLMTLLEDPNEPEKVRFAIERAMSTQ